MDVGTLSGLAVGRFHIAENFFYEMFPLLFQNFFHSWYINHVDTYADNASLCNIH